MDNVWIKYGCDIHRLSMNYLGLHWSGAPNLRINDPLILSGGDIPQHQEACSLGARARCVSVVSGRGANTKTHPHSGLATDPISPIYEP